MFTDIQAGSADTRTPSAAPLSDSQTWFEVAHELARTGQYGNVAEVEAAVRARDETLIPSRNPIVRDAIDIACLRVRSETWWA